MGGRETATEWTRPGAIALNAAKGIAVLGTPPLERGFPIALMDETMAVLPSDASSELFLGLATGGDNPDIDHRALALFGFDTQLREFERHAAERRKEAERTPPRQLEKIALAILRYHDDLAAFPNALVDNAGQAGLSWRVRLLPYFDEPELTQLYKEFRLDQPWDGPQNMRLVARMPDVYRSPVAEQDGMTTFHVFTGPHTPLGDKIPLSIGQIKDGANITIGVVVGRAGTASEWTRPGGIAFRPQDNSAAELAKFDGRHLIALMSGGVLRIRGDLPDEAWSWLVQHDDGENRKLAEVLDFLDR